MDRLRAVIEELQSAERSDLRIRQAFRVGRRTTNRAATAGTIVLAAMLAGVTLLALNRQTRRRMIVEEQRDRRARAASEERARATETLRVSEEELRALFTLSPAGISQVDVSSGQFLRVNPRQCEITGYTEAELLARTFHQITAPDDAEANSAGFRQALATGAGGYATEKRYVRKDGTLVWVQIDATLIRDAEGRASRSMAVVQDIGARKAAEAQHESLLRAEQAARLDADHLAAWLTRAHEAEAVARAAAEDANRTKDEFLSTLSHELRTPLTSILGWANILRTRPMEPAATARALATIERNARTQVQLIEDILDVSRIVADKLRLEIRPVVAAAIVRAAVDVVRPAAEARRIRIEAAIDDATGTLGADPDRLQQIAWNLLSNAIKFTPAGGSVEVRLDRHLDGVRLRVIDHGVGIDAGFLPHVFERFRQADASSTRSQGGLGLGLAIVKHLVELHQGTITAESAGVGQGATFTVTLPASLPSAALPVGGDERTPTTQRLDGVRVVLVDDEPDTREVLASILRGQGATVTTATCAREALRAVERDLPHVLVSDIGLPEVDGYALLQQVRALAGERARGVAALALTAHAGQQAARAAELAGFQKHLAKPVLPGRLIDEVSRLAALGAGALVRPSRADGDALDAQPSAT